MANPKAIEVSLAVTGTVESTAQGLFIGAVTEMPTVALVDSIVVLYLGSEEGYENGRFYQYRITDGVGAWSILSVKAEDFGLTPGTVVTVDTDGTLKSSATTETTLDYLANVTSDIQEQLDNLGSGVTSAERRIDSLETNLTEVTGRVDTAETNITNIEQNVSTIQQDITEIQGDVSEINTTVEDHTTRISTAETDISALETRMDTAESDIDSLESSKQDAVTGGATTILTDNLTANRAVVSDANGKVSVSAVTDTEISYLDGVTSNIQTQIDSINAYVQAMNSLQVLQVDELPESGDSYTIYFVPNTGSGTNVKDEYMWINGAWELLGTTEFVLTITQSESGITINDNVLQTANSSRAGLMPASYVSAVDQAQEDITSINNSISTVEGNVTSIQESISTIEDEIDAVQNSIITSGTLTDNDEGDLELTLNKADGSTIVITSDVATAVPVSSITISGTLAGETGGSLTLVAEVSPDNATNKSVSWNITSGDCVTISSQTGTSCTLSLVSAGTATITATAQDGSSVSQSVQITVTDPVIQVSSITISGDNSGDIGETVTLTASVLPANATNQAVSWAVTSGTSYASIQSQTDSSCVVSLDAEGTATITATAQDGSGVTATHTIAVSTPFVPVTSISISGDTSGNIGTYVTLTATVTPSDATNPAVSWEVTAGTSYIAITSQTTTSCTVYCQAEGTGTVTATAQDGSGISATHQVQSIDPTVYVTAIEIDGDASGTVGGTISLTATVTPSNATTSSVSWSVSSGGEYISISSQTGTSCEVSLDAVGSGVITASATDGSGISQTHEITVQSSGASIITTSGIAMVFDSSTILTDPTGCLTYSSSSSDISPVVNTSTSLATATDVGSWGFSSETGFDCNGLFYATFQSSSDGQYLHELLDPADLTRYIAIWDDDDKAWDYSQTGSSHITTENTMLCIPGCSMLYIGNGGIFTQYFIPNSASSACVANTIDGHTYQYLGIGVYLGYNDSSVLKSISGVTATRSTTADNFRTYAHANTVRDGWAGVWNFWQWSLWKNLTYTRLKSFDGQSRLGQGGLSYSASTTGLCDQLGPFAGDVSGTSSAVKCLIENPWGSLYQFVDDCYCSGTTGELLVGQNSVPTSDTSNKDVTINYSTSNGFGGNVQTYIDEGIGLAYNGLTWTMPSDASGSSTTGTCDYVSPVYSSGPFLIVGRSGVVSNGSAGPGAVGYWSGNTHTLYGARLAFLFDL